MFAREKNRLQTMNTGQRNTKLEKNVGFLMIFAKKSGLNEKKSKKNLQVSSKSPKFTSTFGIYHCFSPHKTLR